MHEQSNNLNLALVTRPLRHINAKLSGAVALQWLLALACVATLYLTKSLMVPIVVSLMFALLLSPMVAFFKRYGVPRSVSALLLVITMVLPFTILGVELAAPAQKWAKLLPELSTQFTKRIDTISGSIHDQSLVAIEPPAIEKTFSLFNIFGKKSVVKPIEELTTKNNNVVTERIKQGGMEVVILMLSATPWIFAQLLTVLILIVFLLIFGPELFSVFIAGFQKVSDKNRVIALVVTIQNEISRYIITVTIINSGLAMATAVALKCLGMEDALLWGVLVGLLNFAPYIGSLIGFIILGLAGLAQYGMVVPALFPCIAYLAINLLESQFVTPAVLSHQMRLNPLVLMIWLLIWGWLWGMVGVLLAVPLLVCIKLIASHLGILSFWLRIIEAHDQYAHRYY